VVDLETIALQPGPGPSVAVSGSVFDHKGNGILLSIEASTARDTRIARKYKAKKFEIFSN
jgi:hypothetical protein